MKRKHRYDKTVDETGNNVIGGVPDCFGTDFTPVGTAYFIVFVSSTTFFGILVYILLRIIMPRTY